MQAAGAGGNGSLYPFTVAAGGQRWLLAAGTQAERQAWLGHLGRCAGVPRAPPPPGAPRPARRAALPLSRVLMRRMRACSERLTP
jgi:hypothetical protein